MYFRQGYTIKENKVPGSPGTDILVGADKEKNPTKQLCDKSSGCKCFKKRKQAGLGNRASKDVLFYLSRKASLARLQWREMWQMMEGTTGIWGEFRTEPLMQIPKWEGARCALKQQDAAVAEAKLGGHGEE